MHIYMVATFLLHCSKFNVFCGDMGIVIVFGNYAKLYMLYHKAYIFSLYAKADKNL